MRLRPGFLAAIQEAIRSGRLEPDPVAVASNNGIAGSLALAQAAGVPAPHLSRATHPDPATLDRAIRDTFREYSAKLVVLSGYMKLRRSFIPYSSLRSDCAECAARSIASRWGNKSSGLWVMSSRYTSTGKPTHSTSSSKKNRRVGT